MLVEYPDSPGTWPIRSVSLFGVIACFCGSASFRCAEIVASALDGELHVLSLSSPLDWIEQEALLLLLQVIETLLLLLPVFISLLSFCATGLSLPTELR